MKLYKSISTLLFSIAVTFSYSQYFPFPTNHATWINIGKSYTLNQWNVPIWQTDWIDRYCSSGIDTIIGTTTYKQINSCTTNSSSYHGALRYETGKVFFIPKDSVNEYLLYDFTVNIGDSVNVIQSTIGGTPYYTTMYIHITDIDTIVVDGTERRRINGSNQYNQWIEGIGSSAGLFMNFEDNISNYMIELNCLSVNNTTIYDQGPLQVGTTGSCDLSLDIPSFPKTPDLKIHPNPVTGSNIFITGIENNELVDLSIFNLNGQNILNAANVSPSLNKIDVGGLESGIYLIQIISDSYYSTQKVIICRD